MKFIKVLWFDLKNGYFKGVSCYIFPLFIAIIGFFELHRRIAIWGTEVALGDYWMYLYGGLQVIRFNFQLCGLLFFCLVRLLF